MLKVIGKKSVDVEAEISPCPCCGGSNVDFAKHIFDRQTEAYARIWCNDCGHQIEKEMDYMNAGIDQPDMYCLKCIISNWNEQYKRYFNTTKSESTELSELRKTNKEYSSIIYALKNLYFLRTNDSQIFDISNEDILRLGQNDRIINYCFNIK